MSQAETILTQNARLINEHKLRYTILRVVHVCVCVCVIVVCHRLHVSTLRVSLGVIWSLEASILLLASPQTAFCSFPVPQNLPVFVFRRSLYIVFSWLTLKGEQKKILAVKYNKQNVKCLPTTTMFSWLSRIKPCSTKWKAEGIPFRDYLLTRERSNRCLCMSCPQLQVFLKT